jgi:hypothetical protein
MFLKSIFDEEKKASQVRSTDKSCTFENMNNDAIPESCFDAKYTGYVGLPGNVTLNSQEAYRLKIYMMAFLCKRNI